MPDTPSDEQTPDSAQPGPAPDAPVGLWVQPVRPSRPAAHDTSKAWMVTFTDLVALMLTFFVLLYAMSNVQLPKWQQLTDSLATNLNRVRDVEVVRPAHDLNASTASREPGEDLDYLARLLRNAATAEPSLADSIIVRQSDRLIIALPGDLLFGPGANVLGKKGARAVFTLGGMLRSLSNAVEVAGHADPSKVQGQSGGNWGLSVERATTVAGLLEKAGYGRDIVVRGYGSSRFDTLDETLSAAQRESLARRVDIVIHDYAAEAR